MSLSSCVWLVVCVLVSATCAAAAAAADEVILAVGNETRCDVPRLPAPPVLGLFLREYRGRLPVVWSRGPGRGAFAASVTREALAATRGDMAVRLSSSNSYSSHKQPSTMAEYLAGLRTQGLTDLANETFTLFGDTYSPEWMDLLSGYAPPPFAVRDEPGACSDVVRSVVVRPVWGLHGGAAALSFGCGAAGSGVSFHTHGAAYSETLIGAKKWYV